MEKRLSLFILLSLTILFVLNLNPNPSTCMIKSYSVTGIAFLDLNANGILDRGECGLSGVPVTNGRDIVITDNEGAFTLPVLGDIGLVYISIPRGYIPITSWFLYVNASTKKVLFGLKPDPRYNTTKIKFIQLTDIHYASTYSEVSDVFKINATISPSIVLKRAVSEILEQKPLFIIITGDIICDANYPSENQVTKWAKEVKCKLNNISKSGILVFYTIGNHDIFDLRNPYIDIDHPLYSLRFYIKFFGPLYYSFTIGNTHFIVLSPHMIKQIEVKYAFKEDQVKWLEKDLDIHKDYDIIVFVHEPPNVWDLTGDSTSKVLNLLKKYKVKLIICGHWHIYSYHEFKGLKILVSPALCGSWWSDSNRDGYKQGYMTYIISGSRILWAYKEVGSKYTISFKKPLPLFITKNDTIIELMIIQSPHHLSIMSQNCTINYTVSSRDSITEINVHVSRIIGSEIGIAFKLDGTIIKTYSFYTKPIPLHIISDKYEIIGRLIETKKAVYTGISLTDYYIFNIYNSNILIGLKHSKAKLHQKEVIYYIRGIITKPPPWHSILVPTDFIIEVSSDAYVSSVSTIKVKVLSCSISELLKFKSLPPLVSVIGIVRTKKLYGLEISSVGNRQTLLVFVPQGITDVDVNIGQSINVVGSPIISKHQLHLIARNISLQLQTKQVTIHDYSMLILIALMAVLFMLTIIILHKKTLCKCSMYE